MNMPTVAYLTTEAIELFEKLCLQNANDDCDFVAQNCGII